MRRRTLVALPVYNEESHILDVLDEVRRYSDEILVVDDGSSDRTPEILSAQTDLRIVAHEYNLGYGAALRSAFDHAVDEGFDVLVTIDCDGQHEPRLIPELAAAVFPDDEPAVDIVSGSRYLVKFSDNSQVGLCRQDFRFVKSSVTRAGGVRMRELPPRTSTTTTTDKYL